MKKYFNNRSSNKHLLGKRRMISTKGSELEDTPKGDETRTRGYNLQPGPQDG